MKLHVLRWIAVPCSGLVIWYGLVVLGILTVDFLGWLCPPDLVVSGFCTAWWYDPAVQALLLLFTAIVAASVVLVPASMAPSHHFHVSVAAYGVGACVAVYFARGESWVPFAVSALTGSTALWFAAKRWRLVG